MKNGRILRFSLYLLIGIPGVISCKDNTVSESVDMKNNEVKIVEYDSLYAQKLGADKYGMKQYVMAFLKKGPNRDLSKEESDSLQRAHLDNIIRLSEEGLLVLAGPFLDKGEIRGIYIFDVQTIEEAEALTLTDPAIQKGSLVMELHPWYGSAAVTEINGIHKQIAKITI